jgi:hypothetical protein
MLFRFAAKNQCSKLLYTLPLRNMKMDLGIAKDPYYILGVEK